MVGVTHAFQSRLRVLDDKLSSEGYSVSLDWMEEISSISLSLYVVSRRLRGMTLLMRKWKEDTDLSGGLTGYLQDVWDHVEEATDDVSHLIQKCEVLTGAYERLIQRGQDEVDECNHARVEGQDKRMNLTLFVLTIVTFVFTPMSVVTALYGMNFCQPDNCVAGNGIPDLLDPNGYAYFWIIVSIYVVTAGSIFFIGWRRVMGRKSIDKDLHTRFPHLSVVDSCPPPQIHVTRAPTTPDKATTRRRTR